MRCRPLPSTAPSPDFNRGPTTRLESLQADPRAVALIVIKDTTNWLAQHKDACTAIKYTIASAATRLFMSNAPPCGTAMTLTAQDIIKLLMVKYIHRDRGFHAEMPLTLKTKLLASYGALDDPSPTADFKVTVPTTLAQYTLTIQDYKPQERNNQGGSINSIIKGKICGHMGDPEIALGNERTLEDLVHTALAKVGLHAQAIRRATDELQSPLDFFYLDMEPSDGIENIYWARMHEIRNIRGPWGNNVTIKLNQEMCEKAYLCHKCLHLTNLCSCSKVKTKPNSTRTSGPATDPFAKYAKLN